MDREFAHIHRHPGGGSLHLKLPAAGAADMVAKGWGEWHPFALSGSAPGMVMVYAPRNDGGLEMVDGRRRVRGGLRDSAGISGDLAPRVRRSPPTAHD